MKHDGVMVDGNDEVIGSIDGTFCLSTAMIAQVPWSLESALFIRRTPFSSVKLRWYSIQDTP